MPKIYVSGPITGLDTEVAKHNFDVAVGFLVLEQHWTEDEIVNPMTLSPEIPGKQWVEYMKEDIAALLECTHIFMLKGWSNSRGARLERTIAIELGLDIQYE